MLGSTKDIRKIIVQSSIQYDWIFRRLIIKLKEEYQTQVILLSYVDNIEARYKDALGPDDQVINMTEAEKGFIKNARPLATEYEDARRYEEKYRLSYLRDIVMQTRSVSCWYLASMPFHPRTGQKPKLSDNVVVINGWFQQMEQWIDDGVDLVFGRPDNLSGGPLVHVAQTKGVPVTLPVSSRYKGFAAWTVGGYRLGTQVQEVLETVPSDLDVKETVDEVRYTSVLIDNQHKVGRLATLLPNLIKYTLIRCVMFLEDLKSGNRGTRASYTDAVRRMVNVFRVGKWMDNVAITDIEKDIEGPFVLYLPGIEPEFGAHAICREFWNTQAIIQHVATCLPAGHTLVIKEHAPGLGTRPVSFYEELSKLPNIRFADYRFRATDIAHYASAVVTLGGTIGYEAGLMGKPVVTFSKRVIYGGLPHVYFAENMRTLEQTFKAALSPKTKEEQDHIVSATQRLYEAIKRLSFDATGTKMFKQGKGDLTDEEFEKAYALLKDNLGHQRHQFENGETLL